MPTISVNSDFFKRWSLEMAYVVGFIYADGSIYVNKNGYEYVAFYSTDLEIIKKIKALVGSSHVIGVKKRTHINTKWKDLYSLQIRRDSWVRDLNKIGVHAKKSLTMEFPRIPKRYFSHFVRGYFDGDGGVKLGTYWSNERLEQRRYVLTHFTCGSHEFIRSLKSSLKPYVKGGYLFESKHCFRLSFGLHGSIELFKFMYHNSSTRTRLSRKYQAFKPILKIAVVV